MKQPHDSWAAFYDFVYEKTFGTYYNILTTETLKEIHKILPNGTIIDYGAGTGRLSIPLKQQGYSVVAVDKSKGMTDVLKNKCLKNNLEIPIYNCSIAEYENGCADLALALFTVLSYTTTEDELSANIKTICRHLKQNAFFFFDLPNPVFFTLDRLINIQSADFNRSVELTSSNEAGIYTYKENCSGILNEQEFNYEDNFYIRYWELNLLDRLLRENGLTQINRSFTQFNTTGSTYKLYQKI